MEIHIVTILERTLKVYLIPSCLHSKSEKHKDGSDANYKQFTGRWLAKKSGGSCIGEQGKRLLQNTIVHKITRLLIGH
jgi:hypothetical protein